MKWFRKPEGSDPTLAATPGGPFADIAAPPPPIVPETRGRKWMRRISRGLAIFFVILILLVGWLALTAPLSKSLEPIAPPQITLLASDGTPIARIGAIVDTPVKAADLPKHVTGAFLAIEDRRFYTHMGVDPRSIARAVWSNVTGGRTQGGSTITQQLAKFTFLTPKRTLGRKAREALIAFWLEAWLTKDEILERYLSNAYFGDNTYGLRAASLHYFYRQPEKLTPAQAAMLAGLVQAPSRLAPTKNPDLAEKRMKLVLNAMVATGYLTEQERKALRTPRIDVRSRNTLPTGTYFADWALPEARKLSDVGYSRQTIATTLDARLQGVARRVTGRAGLGRAQVALVAMRPNGEVVAMIGGKDYAASPFNRATQARRQPGSTTLLELTAAYAAVAANSYPVKPHAFEAEEKGWFQNLISGPSSFGSSEHEEIEQMLRAAVNRGTGRAARLPQANFGKTGTSQDNRDALFVGYANGLVVGVWIGNDDNSPLQGVSGGGLPARIWRDFMTEASGKKAAPQPRKVVDPTGPVEPLDIPDIGDIPIGDRTRIGIEDGDAVISTEINGSRIDLRLPMQDGRPSPEVIAEPPPQPVPPR
ncbi:MAG: hypothetical protein EOP63_12545 [Sphingomonadales bacterium]|nr:MAG: hypothetical protein EOP63_12545 [Sphingomonadales bacterium]